MWHLLNHFPHKQNPLPFRVCSKAFCFMFSFTGCLFLNPQHCKWQHLLKVEVYPGDARLLSSCCVTFFFNEILQNQELNCSVVQIILKVP